MIEKTPYKVDLIESAIDGDVDAWTIKNADGEDLAEVHPTSDEGKQIADLLASAPDLLRQRDALRAACEAFLPLVTCAASGCYVGNEPWCKACAARRQTEAALALCRDAEGGAS